MPYIDWWIICQKKKNSLQICVQKETSAYLDTPYSYSNRIKGAQ